MEQRTTIEELKIALTAVHPALGSRAKELYKKHFATARRMAIASAERQRDRLGSWGFTETEIDALIDGRSTLAVYLPTMPGRSSLKKKI